MACDRMVSGMEVFENIVLVNKDDVFIGTLDKLMAHHQGDLHGGKYSRRPRRARLLCRALIKYCSGGLGTNTCFRHFAMRPDLHHLCQLVAIIAQCNFWFYSANFVHSALQQRNTCPEPVFTGLLLPCPRVDRDVMASILSTPSSNFIAAASVAKSF